MRRGRRTWYHDVLDIPEGVAGDFSIAHVIKPAGEAVPTSNWRTAAFRGQTQSQLAYPHETRWHQLLEDGGVWMTDYPIEQIQHDEELVGFRGKVLVGGLGLGYAATALALSPRVTEVTVVEIRPEVIALVAKHLLRDKPEARAKLRVVQADLFEYLRSGAEGRHFPWAFYDIWTADGERTFHETVMPLRQLSRGIAKQVTCWNETVMRGQMFLGLRTRLMFMQLSSESAPSVDQLAAGVPEDDPSGIYINWAKPFWEWYATTRPSLDDATAMAAQYTRYYGMTATTVGLLDVLAMMNPSVRAKVDHESVCDQ